MAKANDTYRVIAGRKPVLEALEREASTLEKVYLQKGASGRPVDDIRRRARQYHVPIQFVPSVRLERLAPRVNHQGVVALAAELAYADVDEMLAEIAPTIDDVRAQQPLLVALDQIQDPHNYGAIIRSAVAVGAAGIIVPTKHMAPLNTAAVKTSAGTAGRIPIARVHRLGETLFALKERGYWVVGADGTGTTSVWDMDWARPVVLVIGGEEQGMQKPVAEQCDFTVSIPMAGPAESLNASVAAGILLFAAAKERTL